MRQTKKKPLSSDLLTKMHANSRGANYLRMGQIYLYDNQLLMSDRTLKMTQEPPARG